jgi:hypothetical protein
LFCVETRPAKTYASSISARKSVVRTAAVELRDRIVPLTFCHGVRSVRVTSFDANGVAFKGRSSELMRPRERVLEFLRVQLGTPEQSPAS